MGLREEIQPRSYSRPLESSVPLGIAQGFKQKFGVDYDIVFAPTGRIESVRILLCLASMHSYRMKISKFDITTFFLTGEIDMDVYVQQLTRRVRRDTYGSDRLQRPERLCLQVKQESVRY